MADNLLDKASILLTPTAYNDGSMLSVKPNENLYGSELVTNGDFSNGLTNWIVNGGSYATIVDGALNSNNTENGSWFAENVSQSVSFVDGKKYKISFKAKNISGNLNLRITHQSHIIFSENITSSFVDYTIYYTAQANNDSLRIFCNDAVGQFQIDNVSIVEDLTGDFTFSRGSAATRVNSQGLVENVQIISDELVSNGNFSQEGSELIVNGDFATDSNWNKDVNWSIADGIATSTGSGRMFQSISFLESNVGTTVKVSFDITDNSNGGVVVNCYGGVSQLFTGVGTHTFTTTTTDSSNLYFNNAGAGGNFVGSIDNISVKEVGQDWTFGSGWSVDQANSKAVHDSSAGATAIQNTSVSVVVGKKYELKYTASNLSGGYIRAEMGGLTPEFNFSDGTYTYNFTATTNANLYITASANVEVTNISVKEITDDTDLPRIDYTDGCGSWLLEPQSTNLVTYSSDYSQSFYSKDSGVSVGTTNNFSPSGDLNATQINVTDNGRIYANMSSLTYYSTVFIKAGTFSYFKFAGVNVDLVAQTISSGTIKSYGNGWFRIGVAYTGNRPFQVQAYPDATYSSHSTSGSYYIWGSQAEQQSYATSYIPTNGATATRLADVANNSGNSTLINSTEGVLVFKPKYLVDNGASRKISISDGSSSNRLYITPYQGLASRLRYILTTGGVTQADLQITGLNLTSENIFAVVWDNNRFEFWCNGVKISEDTNGTTPSQGTFNILTLGSELNNNTELYQGFLDFIAVYKEALTDAQLQSLTTI